MLPILKGHGFSRAVKRLEGEAALAAEGTQFGKCSFPQGLKPQILFARLTARLKPCPFKTRGFSALKSLFATRLFSSRILMAITVAAGSVLYAQTPAAGQAAQNEAEPIAIVPLDSKNPDKSAQVTGGLEVTQGKAIIVSSGTVTSGTETTQVILPHRGVLRVCSSTSVKLAADTSVPAGEIPGLMIAMDHGAVEASYATGRNSDIFMTPDFRILIGGPGAADVKIRLGQHGDTCVDNAGVPSDVPTLKGTQAPTSSLGWNAGTDAPYVLVSSVFEGGAYRVPPQR